MKKNLLTIALAIIVVFSVNAQRSNSLTKAKHRGGTKTCESTISMVTSEFLAGTTVDLVFEYEYVSPDGEWVDGVSLQFPAGVTVNSATTCTEAGGELTYNGETGDGTLSSWGDLAGGSGLGSLHTNGNFSVNVTIADDFSGDMTLDWFIAGDGYVYAAEPHTNSGSFDIIQTYTVTFVVDDGANPVQNVNIFIDDKELVTNTNGEATIELPDGEYFFGIITTGFENYTGTATVYSETVTIQVHLTAGTAEWPVIFYVTGEDNEPLVGANVELGTYSPTVTDDDGEAFFMVSDEANITYTVTMTNYDAETYTITVDGAVLEKDVQLFLTTYSVTFTANDWKGGVVQDAEITVDNETILADVNGEAVFTLAIKSHNFFVSAEGLVYTGTTTLDVVDQDVNIDVVLYEDIIVPSVTATNGDDGAVIEWITNNPVYEIRYCDDVAENATAWNSPGFANALKITTEGYPCKIETVFVNIYDGTWPAGNVLTEMKVSIFDDVDGLPGTELASVIVTPSAPNWVEVDFSGLGITITDGDFYIVHTQLGTYPDCPGQGIDETNVVNRSYAYNATAGTWGIAVYTDFMMYAVVSGPQGETSLGNTNTVTYTNGTNENSISINPSNVKKGTYEVGSLNKTSKSAQTYDLYFFPEAELSTPDNWTEVSTDIAGNVSTYTDINNWPATIDGVYYWAVKTHYETADSEAGISNALEFYNTYSADFTVTASWGTNDLIDGATITITDVDDMTIEGTTVDGVFSTDLINGNYDYTVTANGFVTATGSFTVDGNTGVDVELDENVVAPFGLLAERTSTTEATLTWNNAGDEFFEGFESGTLPTEWLAINNDGDGFNWINTIELGFDFEAYEGTACMASASFDNDAGILYPDNYLITPAIEIGTNSTLSWFHDAQDAEYTDEFYYVKVSTTGTEIEDFTETIWEGVTSGDWEQVSVNISEQFAGQTVHIAFQHTNCSDMFWMKLDNISVSSTPTKAMYTPSVEPVVNNGMPFRTTNMSEEQIKTEFNTYMNNINSKEVQSYNVYLDDMTTPVATDLTETTFDFTDLTPGIHTAGVEAVYESGNSAIVEIEIDMFLNVESMKSDVNVYPNPSNGLFTVSVNGTYNLQVIDITGKVISTQEITNTESINLQEAGVYMLRLTNNVETLNYKVIVK